MYGLETKRALSIKDMLNGLWDRKLSVILLSDKEVDESKKEEVKEEENAEQEKVEPKSRFVLMTGYDPKGITFFDPVLCRMVHREYSEVLPFMRSAWIISEEEEY